MTMSYLYVSKKKPQKSSGHFWGILAIVALIVALVLVGASSLFPALTSWWRAEDALIQSAGVATYWFGDKVELAAQVDELRDRNDDLQARILQLEAKSLAYDDLTDEIGVSSSTHAGTLAKIVRRPPFTIFDTYIIDRGQAAGVSIGDVAYARGAPVGYVESITESNAIVKLYSSYGEKVLVSFGTTSMQFEAYGIGNGSLRADVPRDADVQIGQAVTASDRDVSIFGNVSAVDKASNSTNKSVFISLPFDLSRTDWFTLKKVQ